MNEMLSKIRKTLLRLEEMVDRYKSLSLQCGSKKRQLWNRVKWSTDVPSLDGLRSKVMYHSMIINLLLTSVGNSSLRRIEQATKAIENDVRAIKTHISHHVAGSLPILTDSSIDDENLRLTLSTRFLESAEKLDKWTGIGIEQWIQCRHWWLQRVG